MLRLPRVSERHDRCEKAASIYSWLADTIVYTEKCDTAYEALVDKRADCFGFAAAFRAIAREAGLECTLVRGKYSSSEHAWNAVKIGKSDDGTGGVWYYVVRRAWMADGSPGVWIISICCSGQARAAIPLM